MIRPFTVMMTRRTTETRSCIIKALSLEEAQEQATDDPEQFDWDADDADAEYELECVDGE